MAQRSSDYAPVVHRQAAHADFFLTRFVCEVQKMNVAIKQMQFQSSKTYQKIENNEFKLDFF